jgi:Dyp-type peroxidase family
MDNLLTATGTALTTVDVKRLEPLLEKLQGNILRAHGRNHAYHVFLRFREGHLAEVKSRLRDYLPRLTTALQQTQPSKANDPIPFVSISISATGYRYFGKQLGPEFDQAFVAGMKSERSILGDPEKTDWDDEHPGSIHAMILLALDDKKSLETHMTKLIASFGEAAEMAFPEHGNALRDNVNPEVTFEHFGYVDGISQPVFFAEDLSKRQADGENKWDPRRGPQTVLTQDPFGPDGAAGSYLVFRKLEQKVAAFWKFRRTLGEALGIDEHRAGALIVGRSEDGRPIAQSDAAPEIPAHKINNFNYSNDKDGLACPFHAHIRKVNPRGSSPLTANGEAAHRIVRRGIPYGERLDPKSDLNSVNDNGRGLLFMCYQRRITTGFEVLQGQWANRKDFPAPDSGVDSVVGQPKQAGPQIWRVRQPAVREVQMDLQHFVSLKGGEYFFTPSISFLETLAKQ